MEEVALRAVFVVVGFHTPCELVDGFGKLVEALVNRVKHLFILQ
jgi:hypothetical protein